MIAREHPRSDRMLLIGCLSALLIIAIAIVLGISHTCRFVSDTINPPPPLLNLADCDPSITEIIVVKSRSGLNSSDTWGRILLDVFMETSTGASHLA